MDKNGMFELIAGMMKKGQPLSAIRQSAWESYGKQCAVLVMDSSGFTQVTQQFGIVAFLTRLIRARQVIENAFLPYRNLSFRAEADNVYAEFTTPQDAYGAAINANHRVLEDEQLNSGGIKFGICTGIGYGRVLDAGHEGVYGNEMNLASKLGEDIAEPGQILLTQAAFQNIEQESQSKFSKIDTTISNVDITYYCFEMTSS